MRRLVVAILALMVCRDVPPAAERLTALCASSPLAGLHIKARAEAGFLVVSFGGPASMDQVEALHYGTGAYAITDGGVRRYYRSHGFRGVVYRDTLGEVRRYE